MGPHSEREGFLPAPPSTRSQPAAIELDFDLDSDTQIDVFVMAAGSKPPPAMDPAAPEPAPSATSN